eukprot:2384729-Rhodomonas_salina.1
MLPLTCQVVARVPRKLCCAAPNASSQSQPEGQIQMQHQQLRSRKLGRPSFSTAPGWEVLTLGRARAPATLRRRRAGPTRWMPSSGLRRRQWHNLLC